MRGTDSVRSRHKARWTLIALALSLVLVDCTGTREVGESGPFCLSILHNNDAESQLLNAGSGALADFGGAAEFVTVVKQEQRDARRTGCRSLAETGPSGLDVEDPERGVVIVSSGDNFLAGPEFTASLDTRDPPRLPFYDSLVVSAAEYDALAIGNHEFDFGTGIMEAFILGVEPPTAFLSANLDFSREPGLRTLAAEGRIAKSIVVRKSGRRIGIIGATAENLATISSPANTIIGAVQPNVQAEIDRLRAEGVEIILLISHLQSIREDLALIALLNGLDVAIAGGSDRILANRGDPLVPGDEEEIFGPYPLTATSADGSEVPVITTAGNYTYLGRLDCLFDDGGRVIACDGGPVRVAQVPESGPAPEDAVRPNSSVRRRVTEPVAAFLDDLGAEAIGTAKVALDGRRPKVRTTETNLGNLIADALLARTAVLAEGAGLPRPVVALQNSGGIRNDDVRGPGPLTRLDTFDILPFSNFLTVVPSVPRARFKQILERAVSGAEEIRGRFAQVAGFSIIWDPNGKPQVLGSSGAISVPGTRVVEVRLDDGTPIILSGAVQPGPGLAIATIDFLTRGGDGYPFGGAPFTILGETYQQALEAFIVETLGGSVTAGAYPEGGTGRIRKRD